MRGETGVNPVRVFAMSLITEARLEEANIWELPLLLSQSV